MAETSKPLLSIMICTRNRRDMLEGALQSFIRCRLPAGWVVEMVVVDNGSTDGTSEMVSMLAPQLPFPVRCIVEPQAGLGRAHATGLNACRGDIIACTDDDCLVGPEWCEAITEAFAAQPELAGLFGRVLAVEDGGNPDWRVAIKTSEVPAIFKFPCWPMIGFGNNMAFKRSALEGVGGFNPLFGPGGLLRSAEELELVYRLLRSGRVLGYIPSVYLWHRGRTAYDAWASTNVRDAFGFGAFAGAYAIRGHLFALKLAVWEWQGMLVAWWQGVCRKDAKRRRVSGWYIRWLPVGFLAGAWYGLRRHPAPKKNAEVVAGRPANSRPAHPDISVVIATRNRASFLKEAALSVLQAAEGANAELIIVDNGSTDSTRDVAAELQREAVGPVIYVYEPRKGVSSARNAGVRVARGAIVAFTDDDCIADKQWFRALIGIFQRDPALAGVFGRVLPLSGSVDEATVSVKTQTEAKRFCFPCSVSIGHGNNMAFRREALQAAGGFDATLGAGTPLHAAEDLDLIYRLLRRGHILAYEPSCVVFHRPRASVSRAEEAECRYGIGFGACFIRYILKGDEYALKYVYWHISSIAGSLMQALRQGRWREAGRHRCFIVGVFCGMFRRCVMLAIKGCEPHALKKKLRNNVTACGLNYWASSRKEASFAMLCYHRVLEQPDPWYRYSVTVEQFERQLALLSRFCRVLPLEEVIERLERGRPLPRRCVVLSFDDGYRDLHTQAWPLLKHYGLAATVFISVQAIERGWLWPDLVRYAIRKTTRSSLTFAGSDASFYVSLGSEPDRLAAVDSVDAYLKRLPNEQKEKMLDSMLEQLLGYGRLDVRFNGLMLSWDELKEMSGGGFAAGAHSMTHPILTRLPLVKAAEEIAQSRQRLQQALGAAVEHFCYPNGGPGDFSADIQRLIREAGFRSACTTLHGLNGPTQDRFALKRIGTTHDSLRTFVRVLEEATE